MHKESLHGLQQHWNHVTPLHALLTPLSVLFWLLSLIRRKLYHYGIFSGIKLPVPVIVVGNITVGGTGKTPATLWLAEQLLANGWHPGIISRGYGGSGTAPQEVSANGDPEIVGDEPVLMAQRKLCPVWVGRKRPEAGQALLAAHPECDILISDDGLQHYRLIRDLELVVIDGLRRFGNGMLLPTGPLREKISRLASVDAVIVNGGTPQAGEFAMQLEGTQFYNLLNPDITASAAEFRDQTLHAIAGIGHPQRFFSYLQEMGLHFTPHAFPDHHRYSAAELNYPGANALLMTEKDAVKCAGFADEHYWVLRVDAQIDPALAQNILEKLDT